MKKLLWLPGYIFIGFLYFFPSEWGKNKNVTRGTRWWNHKDTIAPIISIIFYILIFLIIAMVIFHKDTPTENTSVSQPSQYSNIEPEVAEKENLPISTNEEIPKDYSVKDDLNNPAPIVDEIINSPPEDSNAEVTINPDSEPPKICPMPGNC